MYVIHTILWNYSMTLLSRLICFVSMLDRRFAWINGKTSYIAFLYRSICIVRCSIISTHTFGCDDDSTIKWHIFLLFTCRSFLILVSIIYTDCKQSITSINFNILWVMSIVRMWHTLDYSVQHPYSIINTWQTNIIRLYSTNSLHCLTADYRFLE
jgi:hypothetical protein